MICLEAITVKMIGGIASKLPVAMITPQSMSYSVSELTMVTGTVRVFRSSSALASKNSFQAIRKVKIEAAANPGLISGNTTKKNT